VAKLNLIDMVQLQQIFRPHQFVNEDYIDLYHVYDNLSRTPYEHGVGINCDDPNDSVMNAWHIITPSAMRRHLYWKNRIPTQFLSFYDNMADASQELNRRRSHLFVQGVGRRDPNSVRIAHVRLSRGTNVWAFSRLEMLDMMDVFGSSARRDMFLTSGASEWFVWGGIPEALIQNRYAL
jgi:hypothetical protein